MSGFQITEIVPSTNADLEPGSAFHSLWRFRGTAMCIMDAVSIFACFLTAYYIRFHANIAAFKVVPTESVAPYFKGAALLSFLWVFFIWRNGGYESGLHGIASPIVRSRSIFLAGVKALALHMVVSYMYRELFPARSVYVMAGTLALGSLILIRLLLRELDHDLASQGIALRRVIVVGTDAQAQDFIERIIRLGGTVRIGGVLAAPSDSVQEPAENINNILGTLDDIETVFEQQPFHKIVLSSSALGNVTDEARRKRFIEIVNFCEMHNISLYTLPNVIDVAVAHNEIGTFSGVPLVRLRDAAIHSAYAVTKRAMDITIALGVIIVGMPFWVIIAVLIKLSGKGPILFSQIRAGLHGHPFRMYKFRSMVANATERLAELVDLNALEEPVFKLRNDPRVTSIGRFLRKTGLDEIPQLINVLKGEMSIVGPRPEELALVEKYDAWQRRRLKAKPGITGFQQIMSRGDPSLAVRIKYDLIYLKHQSLLLDLYIMLQTIFVVIRGKGVTH